MQRPLVITSRLNPPADSWWTTASREGFTDAVVREQLPRLRLSKFAQYQSTPTYSSSQDYQSSADERNRQRREMEAE